MRVSLLNIATESPKDLFSNFIRGHRSPASNCKTWTKNGSVCSSVA